MKFYYVGVTRQKEQVSGSVDAADEIEAGMKLRAMQIRPLKLSEGKPSFLEFSLSSLGDMSLGSPVDLKGLMIFTRQFSSLIDAGIPVVQCLGILSDQEKRTVFKKILVRIKSDIEGGTSLAEALAKNPRVFNDFFVRIVEAGEISGTLDVALRRVGAQLEKLGRLRAKVISALTYPTMTVIIAFFVLIFLLVKVIPGITKLYSETPGATLPELTIMVLDLSKWVQANYSLLLFSAFGLIFGFAFVYRLPSFRSVWDPFIIRTPLFGSLILKSEVAKLSRTLGTLIGTGVPLLTAFEIVARLCNNGTVREAVQRASRYVSEGKNIAQGLAEKNLFPPMVVHMVGIGEMTGKLDELLGKVADIYDDEVDDAVGKITGMLQPALIVVVGILIAFLMIAMYLPIFQMAEKISGS